MQSRRHLRLVRQPNVRRVLRWRRHPRRRLQHGPQSHRSVVAKCAMSPFPDAYCAADETSCVTDIYNYVSGVTEAPTTAVPLATTAPTTPVPSPVTPSALDQLLQKLGGQASRQCLFGQFDD